jgi:hypothetical protein
MKGTMFQSFEGVKRCQARPTARLVVLTAAMTMRSAAVVDTTDEGRREFANRRKVRAFGIAFALLLRCLLSRRGRQGQRRFGRLQRPALLVTWAVLGGRPIDGQQDDRENCDP